MASVTPSRRTTPLKIRGRVRRIVHRVDEHAPTLGGRRDLAIDVRRRRRHDQPRVVEIGRPERPALNRDPRLDHIVLHLRRNHKDGRADRAQLLQLGGRNRTAADQQHPSPVEVDE